MNKTTEQDWLLKEKYAGIPSAGYEADLERLEAGEPLAYVIGWVDFLDSRIDLYDRPLIPRPETEWWTKAVISHQSSGNSQAIKILDIFAGSGCIGIALLKHLPHARVDFGEKDPKLCALIKKNIQLNNIDSSRARIIESDIFSAIPERYNMIVANPPYIDKGAGNIALSVVEHEPHMALFAPERGLYFIEQLFKEGGAHLEAGGALYIEFGKDQEAAVRNLGKNYGWNVTIREDQYGTPRWAEVRLK